MNGKRPFTIVTGGVTTPQGLAGIDAAAREARRSSGEVVLVAHVETPSDQDAANTYQDRRATRLQELNRLVSDIQADGVPCRIEMPEGALSPAEALLTVVDEEDADLLVIGMRRRSRVGKLVFGSNAQDILLRAECPVLVVKPER